jgi:predicted RNA-binding protein Jag
LGLQGLAEAAFNSRKENFLNVTLDMSEEYRERFLDINKKQDESNDTN